MFMIYNLCLILFFVSYSIISLYTSSRPLKMQEVIISNLLYTGNNARILELYPNLPESEQVSLQNIYQRALLATNKKPTTPLYTTLYNQLKNKSENQFDEEESNDPDNRIVRGYGFMHQGEYEKAIENVSCLPNNIEA